MQRPKDKTLLLKSWLTDLIKNGLSSRGLDAIAFATTWRIVQSRFCHPKGPIASIQSRNESCKGHVSANMLPDCPKLRYICGRRIRLSDRLGSPSDILVCKLAPGERRRRQYVSYVRIDVGVRRVLS